MSSRKGTSRLELEDVVEISDGKLALMQETQCEVLQGPFKDELTDAM